MRLTFDADKRIKTLVERGLDFEAAASIFLDNHISALDAREDYAEPRYITIGYLASRMVVLVWTPRMGSRRIISMRKANAREQKIYAPRLA